MFINYLKISIRNLWNNKGYAAINIGGLALGMGVAMLIGLWVFDELSFNRNHKNFERIALVMQNQTIHGELKTTESVPFPFVAELTNNYAENFRYIVAATHPQPAVLAAGENKLTRTGQFVGEDAPEMFSLDMLQGSRAGLQDLQSVILSESAASALFGKTDPIGKPILIDSDKQVKVTGIYKDLPKNSRFYDVQFFANWNYFLTVNKYMAEKKWDNHALLLFVQLKPGVEMQNASTAIRNSELNVIRNLDNMQDETATNPQMWLHPMRDWHLYSQFKHGVAENGPVRYVETVALIGFFVLLLACINFMNLSTARSEKRAKEVGIRKAIGSLRMQLIGQFFTESLLTVSVAFMISLLLLVGSLSWFNDLAAKQMHIPWQNPVFWLASLVFIFATGVLAGSYPALYLTSFQPVKVLKGVTGRLGKLSTLPRKILVSTQFTVSITLAICTAGIYNQVQFAKDRAVGYNREGLVMVQMRSEDFYKKSELIQAELKNTGVVTEVALSQSPATAVWSRNNGFTWNGNDRGTDEFASLPVSPEYAKTVGWEFLAGRNFSRDLSSDSSGFVINEAAARLLGFGRKNVQEAVGMQISWQSKWMTNDVKKRFTILGVVSDMVMESPFQKVRPTVFFLFGSPNWINIRIKERVALQTALPKIRQVFEKFAPAVPFEYEFADEEYETKFKSEERVGKLTAFFSTLTILISCLGLFGLAAFVAEQRTKEIGIRKVLGASVVNIWQMLSEDFLVLVVIAAFVSVPVAYWFMQSWLSQYDYKAETAWWIYAGSVLGALMVTLLTVSYQSMKAALVNPVGSLRGE